MRPAKANRGPKVLIAHEKENVVVRNKETSREDNRTMIVPVVFRVSSSLSARRRPVTPPAGISPRNKGIIDGTESAVARVSVIKTKPVVRTMGAFTLREVSQ